MKRYFKMNTNPIESTGSLYNHIEFSAHCGSTIQLLGNYNSFDDKRQITHLLSQHI